MALTLPLSDPVPVFALLVLIILVVPILARRLHAPGIVGLIVAGIAVGPYALNLLDRGPALNLLSTVGLLYLMFIAGLEIDLHEFRAQRRQAATFGLLTFGLAQVSGMVLGRFVLGLSWSSSVLFGSLFASHTLLPYPVVSRLGLAGNPAVIATVGGTMITDTLALLVLAAVCGQGSDQSLLAHGLRLAVGLVVLAASAVWLLPRLGRWFYRRYSGDDTAEFLFLFLGLMGVALVAQGAGLEPVIGAFLAGLALNPLVPMQSRLMNRVRFTGNTLFIPLFLLSVGMVIDVRAFAGSGRAWGVASLMVVSIVVTKFAAARLTQALYGFSRDQGYVMFGLIVNKAVVTLAVALVGYKAGLFDADILNGAIAVILVTCLIGPWVTETFGRRLALQLAGSVQPQGPRRQRVLVPLSNPATAESLLDVAFLVRDRTADEPLLPLTVAQDGPNVEEEVSRVEDMLGHAVVHAAAADVPVRPETRVDTDVAAGIARAVKELRATCVVIGWSGSTAAPHTVFGRVLDRVVEQTTEQVLVCRLRQPANTFRRLLLIVPPQVDRLSGFTDALRTVRNLATQASLPVTVLSPAGQPPPILPPAPNVGQRTPAGPQVHHVALPAWTELWSAVTANLRPHDLVVLVSCRPGSLAWLPGLDRVPQRFCQEWETASLMVAYPAEAAPTVLGPAAPEVAATAPPEAGVAHPACVLCRIGETEGEAFAARLLDAHLGPPRLENQEARATVRAHLADTAMELTPGVALLHAHTDEVRAPVVLVGTTTAGVRFRDCTVPARAAFLILSPPDLPPAEHVANLSELARLVMDASGLEHLGDCRTADEVRACLKAAGRGAG